VLEARSPVTLRKAIKNETELAGMREAHLRDAVAIVEFLTWLDEKARACPPDSCFHQTVTRCVRSGGMSQLSPCMSAPEV
jgi:Xaa-Pro aminopeptidase